MTTNALNAQLVTFLKRKRKRFKYYVSEVPDTDDAFIRGIFAQTPSISNPKEYQQLAIKELQFQRKRTRSVYPEKPLNRDDLDLIERKLITCCLTHVQDSYRVHLNRLEGLRNLEKLAKRALVEDITDEMVVHAIWACLSCTHHFLLRLTVNQGLTTWIRRRQASRILDLYEQLLVLLVSTYYDTIINAIITFFDEGNLWDLECFCSHLILKLLLMTQNRKSLLMGEILDLVENSTLTSSQTACQIVRVLHDVQEAICWTLISEDMITRIIDMYYKSLTPEKNTEYDYKPLEKSLETCLRSMSFHLDKDNLLIMVKKLLELAVKKELIDDHLLNFGSLAEHVSGKYNNIIGDSHFPADLFPLVLELMASDRLFYSLLGNRIMHNLSDRMKNKKHLDTPVLFFRNAKYDIVPNRYNSKDKRFFQKHRELLQRTFVEAVVRHGNYKVYLEMVYVSMALWILEVPCGYTAAAATCTAIAIQDAVLNNTKLELTHAHCLHATVISLLSLVCYVHHADVFYDYVDRVIEKRAAMAPHLNPPLRSIYKYAQHHVLWNKSDFFFEDWETRYGLWKCFRTKKTDDNVMGLF